MSWADREKDCAEQGHPSFEVISKRYKRSAHFGEPVQVRCTHCGRRWPVITKDSWIPTRLREGDEK